MHNIKYDQNHVQDPNYEFPSHDDFLMPIDEQTPEPQVSQTITPNSNQNVPSTSSADNLQHIGLVESSVNEIKDEMRSLVATITSIIQPTSPSNQ